jgi:uncharacterized protein YwqG
MGLFDRFRKPPPPPPEPPYRAPEATRRPFVAIAFSAPTTPLPATASRLGGIPYIPIGEPPPPADHVFIAQINFAEVPALEPLPRDGLLQLWVHDDDLYGLEDGFRCVYRTDLTPPPRTDLARDAEPRGPLADVDERRMIFSLDSELAPGNGYDAAGHKLGGYCAFTQDDPRSPDDPMFSLLQLDSDAHIFWGDTGLGHWFIREPDLRARDFSRVVYYWDCC